jgi:hypothetical protein
MIFGIFLFALKRAFQDFSNIGPKVNRGIGKNRFLKVETVIVLRKVLSSMHACTQRSYLKVLGHFLIKKSDLIYKFG